jgi:two-component system nitrogen regulation response regulator GlnG
MRTAACYEIRVAMFESGSGFGVSGRPHPSNERQQRIPRLYRIPSGRAPVLSGDAEAHNRLIAHSTRGLGVPWMGARILVVDDEKDICDILFRVLERGGFSPCIAHDGDTALHMIRTGMPDLLISDVKMSGMDGMELLRRAKELNPNLPVLMITGWGGIDGAVRAIKAGAFDYLAKPIKALELLDKIKSALDTFPQKTTYPQPESSLPPLLRELQARMGPSDAVGRIISEIAMVGPSDFSVIIRGETGTGKEMIAHAIHDVSARAKGPMIPVDCGAIPENLFESELFGHEKGAFTGAAGMKRGKFELAEHGALFLDEIGNMALSSQVKLLRAIQEKSFFRVGGVKPVHVDVRLIVATNEDLNAAVRDRTFSRDLFYRLSEFTIHIPPIRERPDDLIHIAGKILAETNKELGKSVAGFSEAALQTLTDYPWPGNIRELRSAVRRAVLQAEKYVEPLHLAIDHVETSDSARGSQPAAMEWTEGVSMKDVIRRAVTELEKRVLEEALRKAGGNKAKAARMLQMDYTTVHAKLKLYNIVISPGDN